MLEIKNEKDKNSYRQLLRNKISQIDISVALNIGKIIIENHYHEQPEKREILNALNAAMIISYGRPFSGNDKGSKNKLGDLPCKILSIYDDKENVMHKDLINRRNKIFAHSDYDMIDMKINHILDNDWENPTLMGNGKYFYFFPYEISNVKIIVEMCGKLLSELGKRQNDFAAILKKFIPETNKDDYIVDLEN